MENLNQVISENLKSLRKKHKLTQTELAEKINYSNKAVSRWETGEVIPDVITLNSICEIYNIPLSAIFEENAAEKKFTRSEKVRIPTMGNRLAISLISIIFIWFIATVVYVSVKVISGSDIWQVFIYAIPASCIVGIVFNSIWGYPMIKHVLLTILNWSILTSVYLSLLKYNLWIVFMVGIPVQIAIILWANITSNNIKRKRIDKKS